VLVQSWQLSPRAHKMLIMKIVGHSVACKHHGDLWCGARAVEVKLTIAARTHTLPSQTAHVDTRWWGGRTSSAGHSQCGALVLSSSPTNANEPHQGNAATPTPVFEYEGVKPKGGDACDDRGGGCSEGYWCINRLQATTMGPSDVGDEGRVER
jgi:hypothetical protein